MAYDPTRTAGYVDPFFEFRVSTGHGGRWNGGYRSTFNLDIGTTPVTLWPSTDTFVFQATSAVLDVVSTSALDTDSGGTGLHEVIILGLDSDYCIISEIVKLDGITPVSTINSYLRVNSMVGLEVGSSEENVGTINATNFGTGDLQASILPGQGKHLSSVATIDDTSWGIITRLNVEVQGDDTIEFLFESRIPGNAWRAIEAITIPSASSVVRQYMPGSVPIMLLPRSDIRMVARKIGGGQTAGASASFGFYTIDKREIQLTDDVSDI